MANYQAARALIGKGRNAGEGAAGLSKSSAKKGAREVRGEKGETKAVTLGRICGGEAEVHTFTRSKYVD